MQAKETRSDRPSGGRHCDRTFSTSPLPRQAQVVFKPRRSRCKEQCLQGKHTALGHPCAPISGENDTYREQGLCFWSIARGLKVLHVFGGHRLDYHHQVTRPFRRVDYRKSRA